MKAETQHLDYLISQYVDGCLDPASKKSVEQQLLRNPSARQLYKDHHDTQELLDDWGNRIPMIDWDAFDKKLAGRLEQEVVGGMRISRWQRWAKPLAAAAALMLAAGMGYMWHGSTQQAGLIPERVVAQPVIAPHTKFAIVDGADSTAPFSGSFMVVDGGLLSPPAAKAVATIVPPGDSAAVRSLKEAVSYGLRHVDQLDGSMAPGGTYAIEATVPKKDDGAAPPP